MQGFARLWERIHKDCDHLGEDLQGFVRLWGGFVGICEISGEDLEGFVRLWERICKDSQDFGRGFVRPLERI